MKRFLQWTLALLLLGSLTFDYERGFHLKAAYAQATGSLTLSWTPPAFYTDGFPLLEQDLDFYTLYCNDVPVKQIDSIIGTSTDVLDLTTFASGDYACNLSVTDLPGAESGRSNDINFTIGPRVPGTPANLTSA